MDQFVEMRYDLAVDKGVLITQIVQDSPAIQAGLYVGDIIAAIDGEKTDTVVELTRILHSAQIGQQIAITFWRDDEQFTVEAPIEENPPPP